MKLDEDDNGEGMGDEGHVEDLGDDKDGREDAEQDLPDDLNLDNDGSQEVSHRFFHFGVLYPKIW